MESKIMPKRIRNVVLTTLTRLDDKMKKGNTSFTDIHDGVKTIIDLQKDYAKKPNNRVEHMNDLLMWALKHSIDCNKVTIAQYTDYGFGLQATEDIKKGESFIEIPMEVVFSHKSFLESDFGQKIRDTHFTPGVVMALALMAELYKPDSFWKEYISTLPNEYSIPLYFTPEEFCLLKETTVFNQAFKFYQLTLSQYFFIFKLMEEETDKKKLWPFRNFCFNDFRWAFCTALSRQNTVRGQGGIDEHVLIPLWDMCNHAPGVVTTFCSNKDTVVSEAMMDFKKGEQIFIYYGDKSISDMFINGGYIVPHMPYIEVPVLTKISNHDECHDLKVRVLTSLGFQLPHSLKIGTVLSGRDLAFVRIFCMPKKLLHWFQDHTEYLKLLEEQRFWISIKNEIKVWDHLLGKCKVIEMRYSASLEDDIKSLKSCQTDKLREIYKLRIEEKKTIRRFASYTQHRLDLLSGHALEFESAFRMAHGNFADDSDDPVTSCPLICIGPKCMYVDGVAMNMVSKCCHLHENQLPGPKNIEERYILGFKKLTMEEPSDEVLKVYGDYSQQSEPDGAKEVVKRESTDSSGEDRTCVSDAEEISKNG